MNWLERLRVTIAGSVTVRFDLIPTAPDIIAVTFTEGTDMALKGLIVASAPAASGVTRTASISLNGAAAVSLDITDPTVTFDCNDGDTYSITAVDSNSAGASPVSNTLTGTCSLPVSVPSAPVLQTVTFTAA